MEASRVPPELLLEFVMSVKGRTVTEAVIYFDMAMLFFVVGIVLGVALTAGLLPCLICSSIAAVGIVLKQYITNMIHFSAFAQLNVKVATKDKPGKATV